MGKKHTAIEHEIVRAAADIFSTRGYQATTLDDIAAAAHISRATFYNYFPSKDELLRRMYRQVISSSQTAVERIANEPIPVPEKLRQIIRFLISYLSAHTALMQVFFSEFFNLSSTMNRSVTQAHRAFRETIQQIVEEGVRAGVLVSLDPKRFTYVLLGACNWMYRWYRPSGKWTPDIIAEEIIRLLESGYLPQKTRTEESMLAREVHALRGEVRQLKTSLQGDLRMIAQDKNGSQRPARRSRGSLGSSPP